MSQLLAALLLTRAAFAQSIPLLPEPPPEPPPASAPPEPAATEPPFAHFGAKGVFVISGGTSIGVSSSEYDASAASSFGATFSPGVDYFFLENVSIGLDVNVAYSDGKGYGADGSLVETTTTTLSAGPRIGVNVPLGKAVSLWPRLTLGVEYVRQEEQLVAGRSLSIAASAIGTDRSTQSGPWVSFTLPLLIHPVPHFFFGPGVTVFHEFARTQQGPDIGGQRTSVSGSLLLGGYFGGTPDSRPEVEPSPRARRFGEAGQLVVSGGSSLFASYLTHAGSGTSSTRFGILPAIDYFAANHVSIGLGVDIVHGDREGIDPTTQAKVSNTTSTVGVGPRLGFDLPLTAWASLRPLFYLELGSGSTKETSGASTNEYTDTFVWTSASAFFLVHPAPHVFLGFGPSIGHDLSHSYSPRDAQIRETRVGAGFTLGAWL